MHNTSLQIYDGLGQGKLHFLCSFWIGNIASVYNARGGGAAPQKGGVPSVTEKTQKYRIKGHFFNVHSMANEGLFANGLAMFRGSFFQFHLQCLGVVCKFHIHG